MYWHVYSGLVLVLLLENISMSLYTTPYKMQCAAHGGGMLWLRKRVVVKPLLCLWLVSYSPPLYIIAFYQQHAMRRREEGGCVCPA